jgi:hypothetical protein
MMSSDRRRPFGKPARSPPSTPSLEHVEEHGGIDMFRRIISLGVPPLGMFSLSTPVRNTEIRSARWMPGVLASESGIVVPYTAFNRCGSSGSCTSGRAAPSAEGLEELK